MDFGSVSLPSQRAHWQIVKGARQLVRAAIEDFLGIDPSAEIPASPFQAVENPHLFGCSNHGRAPAEHAELEEMILQKLVISLKRGDPGRSIDLTRHDCWWPRARCLDALVE